MKTVEGFKVMSKPEVAHYLYARVFELAEEFRYTDDAERWPGEDTGERMGQRFAEHFQFYVGYRAR